MRLILKLRWLGVSTSTIAALMPVPEWMGSTSELRRECQPNRVRRCEPPACAQLNYVLECRCTVISYFQSSILAPLEYNEQSLRLAVRRNGPRYCRRDIQRASIIKRGEFLISRE